MEGGGEGGVSPGSPWCHSSNSSWSKSSLDVKAEIPPMFDMMSSMEASVARASPGLLAVTWWGPVFNRPAWRRPAAAGRWRGQAVKKCAAQVLFYI